MITITKIFRFEAAHAIHLYPGECGQIHGHSYELHVTVQAKQSLDQFIEGQGIILDFKELKNIVQHKVISQFDHKLVLSKAYLSESKCRFLPGELVVFDVEPTAENLVWFMSNQIKSVLPKHVHLYSLKLWETSSSYAAWLA